jgi:hypothetical protein
MGSETWSIMEEETDNNSWKFRCDNDYLYRTYLIEKTSFDLNFIYDFQFT